MTTSIDTNVLVALWQADEPTSSAAQRALDRARSRGDLAVCAPVYSELLAFPGRHSSFLDAFFRDTLVHIDWEFTPQDWRDAGKAFQSFAHRRRTHSGPPRRILADFLIGAHAHRRGQTLLTLDAATYRTSFPTLKLVDF
jgi:predicted nucleic acid-binding protein